VTIFDQPSFSTNDIQRVCEEFEYLFNGGYVHLIMDFEEEDAGLMGMIRDVHVEATRRDGHYNSPKLSIKHHETVKTLKKLV
jgi:hypothetical protein